MQGLLQTFNLAAQLLGCLGTVRVSNLTLHLLILFPSAIQLDLLFVDDAAELINDSLKLLNRLKFLVSELDCVTLGRDLLTRDLGRLLLNRGQLLFTLIL